MKERRKIDSERDPLGAVVNSFSSKRPYALTFVYQRRGGGLSMEVPPGTFLSGHSDCRGNGVRSTIRLRLLE